MLVDDEEFHLWPGCQEHPSARVRRGLSARGATVSFCRSRRRRAPAGKRVCAVVDPLDNIGVYVRAAAETRMNIRYVIDRHVHADHVSGGRKLALAVGADYVRHSSAAGRETMGVDDAHQLTIGNIVVDVYPALLAAIADRAHPSWRASAVGVYRLWRDLGYAVGAILSGVIADWWGLRAAISVFGALTFASGVICAVRMIEPESR
jgi:hypothetical protein